MTCWVRNWPWVSTCSFLKWQPYPSMPQGCTRRIKQLKALLSFYLECSNKNMLDYFLLSNFFQQSQPLVALRTVLSKISKISVEFLNVKINIFEKSHIGKSFLRSHQTNLSCSYWLIFSVGHRDREDLTTWLKPLS